VTVETSAALESVTSAVLEGVAGVREQFPGHTVDVTADGSGGVIVIVEDVPTGGPYVEESTWLGFQINSAYPMSDVYPHFVGRLLRTDKVNHGEGFSETTWQDRPALQLSRRSNRWDPRIDTAGLKAMKVLAWLASC
jgi:hypothetical protein